MVESIDEARCTGCGLCVEVCPLDTLRLNPVSGKAHIAYVEDCMTCYRCEMACPARAINVHPFKELLPPSVGYVTRSPR
jgi:NAD-dependent dihydropyrimidine dehydrogenase PreA subunit